MSEYFTGITFPQQKVTPSYDAIIRKVVFGDGILSGCELSYSGYTLTMGAGLMIACGRQFLHTAVQNWAVAGATSGYARLLLTIDTTRASTKETFDQILGSIEYASAIDGFLELRQDDINEAGTVYQFVACVVSLGAGGITGIVEKLGDASKFRPNTWLPEPEEIGALSMKLLWENASPSSNFAAQTISLDLSGYDFCEIFYHGVLNDSGYATSRVPVGYSVWMYVEWNARYVRKATVMTTGVEFGAGYGADFGSSTVQEDSRSCIPLAIYGIKGVN